MTVNRGAVICLNEVEQRFVKYVAAKRQGTNDQNGVTDKKRSPRTPLELHIDGFGAEVAFCKLTNTYPDTTTNSRSDRDGHEPDAYVCGSGVDVKLNLLANGDLLCVPWKVKDDLYALMLGKFPHYRFIGFTTGEMLQRRGRIVDLGHGDTLVMPQAELYAPAELFADLNESDAIKFEDEPEDTDAA